MDKFIVCVSSNEVSISRATRDVDGRRDVLQSYDGVADVKEKYVVTEIETCLWFAKVKVELIS